MEQAHIETHRWAKRKKGDTIGTLNERGVAKINLMNILHVDENH